MLQVASSFLSGLQNAAQGCINGLPSINGDSSSTVITDQYNKCCPVIKAVSSLSICFSSTISLSTRCWRCLPEAAICRAQMQNEFSCSCRHWIMPTNWPASPDS